MMPVAVKVVRCSPIDNQKNSKFALFRVANNSHNSYSGTLHGYEGGGDGGGGRQTCIIHMLNHLGFVYVCLSSPTP